MTFLFLHKPHFSTGLPITPLEKHQSLCSSLHAHHITVAAARRKSLPLTSSVLSWSLCPTTFLPSAPSHALQTMDGYILFLSWFRSVLPGFSAVLYVSMPASPDSTDLSSVRHRGGKKSSQQLSPLIYFSPVYQKLRNPRITSANPALPAPPCLQCSTCTLAKLILQIQTLSSFSPEKHLITIMRTLKCIFFHPVTFPLATSLIPRYLPFFQRAKRFLWPTLFTANLLFLSLSPNCSTSFHFEITSRSPQNKIWELSTASLPTLHPSLIKLCNFRACLPLAMHPGTHQPGRDMGSHLESHLLWGQKFHLPKNYNCAKRISLIPTETLLVLLYLQSRIFYRGTGRCYFFLWPQQPCKHPAQQAFPAFHTPVTAQAISVSKQTRKFKYSLKVT